MTAICPVLTTAEPPVWTTEHTTTSTPGLERVGGREGRTRSAWFVDSGPFRAVGGSGIIGIPGALRVKQDRFDHAVTASAAIDYADYAVRRIGRDELGLTVRVVVLAKALGERPEFRPN